MWKGIYFVGIYFSESIFYMKMNERRVNLDHTINHP